MCANSQSTGGTVKKKSTVPEQLNQLREEIAQLKKTPKDNWDKASILGAIALPIAIALAGHWYSQSQEAANRQRAAEAAALEQAKLVETFLNALTSDDPRRQQIAISSISFAIPKKAQMLISGIYLGACANRDLAVVAAETELKRLADDGERLVNATNDILEGDPSTSYREQLNKSKGLIATIIKSYPEMITPANLVVLNDALRRIESELAKPEDDSVFKEAKEALKKRLLNHVQEARIKEAIDEWRLLRDTVSEFLALAKKNDTPREEIVVAFDKVSSSFLRRMNSSAQPPQLFRILQDRVYPSLTLIEMTRQPTNK